MSKQVTRLVYLYFWMFMYCILFQGPLKSEDYGKHLISVEDLLHQHSLIDTQVNNMGRKIAGLNKKAQELVDADHPSSDILCNHLENLNEDFEK